jgi:hypothetical protein
MATERKQLSYEEQVAALATPAAQGEIVRATKYKPAHMPGSIVEHKLNTIFGPDNWGVRVEQWPTLETEIGTAPFYHGKFTIWFRFDNGSIAERPAIGWIAAQPARGGTVKDIMFSNVQMAMEGCLTEAIKFGASTLGPALGLGMHNETAMALIADENDTPSSSPAPKESAPPPASPSDAINWDMVRRVLIGTTKLPDPDNPKTKYIVTWTGPMQSDFVDLAKREKWDKEEVVRQIIKWDKRKREDSLAAQGELADMLRVPKFIGEEEVSA